MTLEQVVCRLPGEYATKEFKRRIDGVDKFTEFFKITNRQTQEIKEIKEYINEIIDQTTIDELLNSIDSEYYHILYKWLNSDNSDRILKEGKEGKDGLPINFLFNLTDKSDLNGLKEILNKILSNEPKASQIISVLCKSDQSCFQELTEIVLKDDRPFVRTSILSIMGARSFNQLTETQKVTALSALSFGKSNPDLFIQVLDFNLFKQLEAIEKLKALKFYLEHFYKFKRTYIFCPEIDLESFDNSLKDCSEYDQLKNEVVNLYDDILKLGVKNEN